MEKEKKSQGSGAVSSVNWYAVLSYLWVLCLIPVFMKKDDGFVRFHARQGVMLFIVEIGIGVISIIPGLGGFIYLLGMIVCGLVSLVGIVQVLMGNKWEIPLISKWAEKLRI